MTNTATYASRRDRRRAARKSQLGATAASTGRSTAAVLAASGLIISSGAAANASEDSDEGRESATVQLNTAELNVERTSVKAPAAVTTSSDVELSFDRPVVSSESAPEPEPAQAPAPEPTVEATPASQQTQQVGTQQQAHSAQQVGAPQQSQPAQQAPHTHEHSHSAPQQSQSQQQAESQQQAQSAPQQDQSQQQTEPAQQSQSSSNSSGASPAGGTSEQPANSGSSSSVVAAAYAAIGTPYSWGGTSTSGFDCSGLINWAYDQAGRGGLPRTTYGMDASLPRVSSPQPGDIVLANNNGHGGIYVGNGQVISATSSGGVRLHGINESWHQVNAILRPN